MGVKENSRFSWRLWGKSWFWLLVRSLVVCGEEEEEEEDEVQRESAVGGAQFVLLLPLSVCLSVCRSVGPSVAGGVEGVLLPLSCLR